MFATILPFGYLLWPGVCWAIGYKVQRDLFLSHSCPGAPLFIPLFYFPIRIFAIEFHNTCERDSRKMSHQIEVKNSFLLSYQPEAGEPGSHSVLFPVLYEREDWTCVQTAVALINSLIQL